MSAAGHRANEDVAIGEVFDQADAIPEDRTMRKGRTWIDRNDADGFAGGARGLHERRRQRRLADARRSGDADRDGATAARKERMHQLRSPSGFGATDRARESARVARFEQRQNLAVALVHLKPATCVATRGRSRTAVRMPPRAPMLPSVANTASAVKRIDQPLGPPGRVSAPTVKNHRISAHRAEPAETNASRAISASTASNARCGASIKM